MSGSGGHIRLRLTCVCLALALLAYVGLTQWALGHTLFREHPGGSAGSLPLAANSHPEDASKSINDRMLFFNRVPKSGSEMLVLLLQWLQGQNTFRHIRLRNSVRRYLSHGEQLDLAAEIGEKIFESAEPRLSFDRHVYFTNFSTLGLKMPVYLNLIRDPVEKAASRFYYSRVTPRPGAVTPAGYHLPAPPRFSTLEECVAAHDPECVFISGQKYDLSIPYFCGHEEYCRELNNKAALNTAKRHVEHWYPVVGILEDINSTLAVLQDRLPSFFDGVLELYYNQLLAPHHNRNRHRPRVSEEVEQIFRKNLTTEYEFYDFIRQRLSLQYQTIKLPEG
ncbi:heparan sulfate 2-O-sulfotransferase pipe-like [Penaeus japonicus]|uniref:heparan sulfate 2-O-sulfotransferase pipe-like n=1 Tax=Penaeus japonicus TaxID=27405 RepID=UPI001C70FDB5|nr:heparan sulfate 2-O-sulfotransferase pipe-like [Penaeus japonicus]XP_042887558.1 heparan sulfate 2-O-sulfotransferase pipe-like [Penaeus japonicus]XP_042887559.1 heparan sulfate 2-O-sulfotransferase pipe-like [Penaeus japonicus]XP_042887560.1 heparan sulfate 2-O-sulfotransferase pipe-like [Penaeus japonicus]